MTDDRQAALKIFITWHHFRLERHDVRLESKKTLAATKLSVFVYIWQDTNDQDQSLASTLSPVSTCEPVYWTFQLKDTNQVKN